jgi:hypothetical protein
MAAASSCWAQSLEETRSTPNDRGFTLSTYAYGYHDSVIGWSSIVNFSVRYDFNSRFGMEIGAPYYMTQTGYDFSTALKPSQARPLVQNYGAPGDTYLALHFAAPGSVVGYSATLTGTAPSGDTSTGISTGRPTADLTNRLEHTWSFFTPFAELGIGDSSALADRRTKRPYTTLGPLSHYKAGASLSFLRILAFQAAGFEDLPIDNQKVYSAVPIRGKNGAFVLVNGKKTYHYVATGKGILEDNGLSGGLTLRLGPNVMLSGIYERSLRQSYDTVMFGVGYTFRRTRKSSSLPVELEDEEDAK